MTPEAIADRLRDYSGRLRGGSISRAQALWTIWQSFNDANKSPLREERLPRSSSAAALNLMASATLHDCVLILVRALDGRGNRKLFSTNRVSFPIMAELAEQPGVREELERRARAWVPDLADENACACLDALDRIRSTLDRLESEKPNREQRLRDFRDQFLAHNLELEDERARPEYVDITGLLNELTTLSRDAELAFGGADTDVSSLQREVRQSAEELWRIIRRGASKR